MNEAGANALYEADRKGVRQITGATRDWNGGRCAIGVLGDAGVVLYARVSGCPLCGQAGLHQGVAGLLDLRFENDLVVHFNDHHGLTFSEIARKLGPDAA